MRRRSGQTTWTLLRCTIAWGRHGPKMDVETSPKRWSGITRPSAWWWRRAGTSTRRRPIPCSTSLRCTPGYTEAYLPPPSTAQRFRGELVFKAHRLCVSLVFKAHRPDDAARTLPRCLVNNVAPSSCGNWIFECRNHNTFSIQGGVVFCSSLFVQMLTACIWY